MLQIINIRGTIYLHLPRIGILTSLSNIGAETIK